MKNATKRGFTPLEKTTDKEQSSLTGFTPLETIGRRKKPLMFLTGFTLVEIMIVVGIIMLILALAMPNFLRMRINTNETAAAASLRTISTAMENYRAAQTPPAYATDLLQLSSSIPPYIDSVLGSGTKQGYEFVLSGVSEGDTYTCTATPRSAMSGARTFVVTQSGVITSGGNAVE